MKEADKAIAQLVEVLGNPNLDEDTAKKLVARIKMLKAIG
jgi:hypothetical protein